MEAAGTHGGAREGAGPKPRLKDPKRVLVILEPAQEKTLQRLAKELKRKGEFLTAQERPRLPSRSEVIRYVLDNYTFA